MIIIWRSNRRTSKILTFRKAGDRWRAVPYVTKCSLCDSCGIESTFKFKTGPAECHIHVFHGTCRSRDHVNCNSLVHWLTGWLVPCSLHVTRTSADSCDTHRHALVCCKLSSNTYACGTAITGLACRATGSHHAPLTITIQILNDS
jgi:hypothetical protein